MNLLLALLRRGLGVWINYPSYYLDFGVVSPFPIGYVFLELTRRCNLKCTMCNIWGSVRNVKKEKEEELNWAAWSQIISGSKSLRMMPKINLTGGEPFLREDIVELVSNLLKMSHIQQVCIASNGSLPSRILVQVREMLEACPQGKNLEVAISLDGLGKLHDEIRGIPGLFAMVRKTLLGLCELRDRYPQLKIISNAVLQPANIDAIEELMHFLNTYKISSSCGLIQYNTFFGNQDTKCEIKGFREKQLNKIINIARSKEKLIGTERYLVTGVRPLSCYAGYNSVFISSKGLVYPCVSMAHNPQFSLGDLSEIGFDAIWRSAQSWQVRRITRECNACWNVCELRATRLQHIFGEWCIKFASFGLLDYYKLRGMR